MLKSIPISELKPGMMVTQVLEQHGPVKIRRVGLIKSEAMVKGLTEMGVSLLEVDEAQSFTFETDEALAESDGEASSALTPTQRLMAEDKNSAAVDRQLSQQFHRSLFMPAIDEMPSKWRLYYRPYALLFGFILGGFLLGFVAISLVMQIPSWLSPEAPPSAQISSSTQVEQTVQARSSQPAYSQSAPQPSEQSVKQATGETSQVISEAALQQGQSSSINQELANDAQQISGEIAQNDSSDGLTQNDINDSSDSQSSDPQSTDPQSTEPTRSFESINGIVLNEGERVLGYGAAEDSESAPATNDLAGAGSALAADLLNRVNQAAAQIEAEQDSVASESTPPSESIDLNEFLQNTPTGPVVDLRRQQAQSQTDNQAQRKPTVRIDQLPPAVLTQMPAMSFSAHMFASNPQDRWVRVNGRRLSEGDFIDDGLSIVEIQSERIVLAFKGETFTMNALSDW